MALVDFVHGNDKYGYQLYSFIVGRKFKKVKKKQEEEGVRRGRETAEYLKSL